MNQECQKCGDSGILTDADGTIHECECSLYKRLAMRMPAYIRMAKVTKRHLALPICNQVKDSLFVIARWADVRAIIKAVMIRNHSLLIQMTSDRELRDVFVGSTSKTSRAEDSDQVVYNSLSDIMSPPDLMIVRLNELKYKNKAMAGVLEEALSYRLDRFRPTWVISDPTDPFGQHSHAYSQNVWEMLHTCFENVTIPQILTMPQAPSADSAPRRTFEAPPAEPDGLTAEEFTPTMGGGGGTKRPKAGVRAPRAPRPTEEEQDNPLLASYGAGKTTTWKDRK